MQSSPVHNDTAYSSLLKTTLIQIMNIKKLRIVHATEAKITDTYIKSFKR